MKKFIFLLILPIFLFSYQVDIKEWKSGLSFYQFLQNNSIPVSVYYNLDKKTQKMVRNISSGVKIYLIKDNNNIKQALIPLDDDKQLQIINKSNSFMTKVVPIYYEMDKNYIEFEITNFLSYDVYQNSKNPFLSNQLTDIFNDKINFRHLPKNSKVKVYYENKIRFGEVVSTKIIYASISNRLYSYNAYLNEDGRYYDDNGKSLKGMFLVAPIKYRRISSPYGMRFHPILKRYRMHHGIDYVNRVGTPIKSVADGVVIYKGWLGGYGKTVKVKHKNGYMTIYGHLKGYGNIRKGSYITQGKVIGYLGNTGMSTGAHLHFGVSRYNKWINPNKIKTSSKVVLNSKNKKKFLSKVREINQEILSENKLVMK
jgi:murein DD-endopeptidase MepM/ murein hydrolase activator NlpD